MFGAVTSASAARAPQAPYRPLIPTKAPFADVCLEDSLRISPDGSQLLMMMPRMAAGPGAINDSGSSDLLRLPCLAQQPWGACAAHAVVYFGRLSPLGWTSDSQTLYARHMDHLVALSLDAQAQVRVQDDPTIRLSLGPDVPVAYHGTLPNESRETVARMLEAQWSEAVKLAPHASELDGFSDPRSAVHLFADQPPVVLVKDWYGTSDVSAVSAAGGQSWRVTIASTFFMKSPDVLYDPAGRLWVTTLGQDYLISTRAAKSAPVASRPYELPIVSSTTGQRVGEHGQRWLKWGAGAERASRGLLWVRGYLAANPGWILREVTVAEGGALAASLTDFAGRRVLILSDGKHEQAIKADCVGDTTLYFAPKSGEDLNVARRPPIPVVEQSELNLGDAGYPLWAQLIKAKAHNDRIVVYLHGGPSAFLAYHDDDAIANLLRRGFDVLIPEYSGSSGAGVDVTARLAKLPPSQTLERDMRLIDGFVARSGYGFRLLFADSFGGVMVYADEDRPRAYDAVFLETPFLEHHGSDWAGRASSAYQRLFESRFMSPAPGAGNFDRWLSARRATWRPASPTAIIFAPDDPRSVPGDIPAQAKARVTFELPSDVSHASVDPVPEVWRLFDATVRSAEGEHRP